MLRIIKRVALLICFFGGIFIFQNHNPIPKTYFYEMGQNNTDPMQVVKHGDNVTSPLNLINSATKKSTGRKLLVDTEKCKIPDLDLWSPDILKLVSKMPSRPCSKGAKLSFVRENSIVIDTTELKRLGFSFKNLSCCYQRIERVNEPKENYGSDADNKYRYSKACYPMTKVTNPISEFVKVTCKTSNGSKKTIYKNLHVLAKFSNDSSAVVQKLAYWKNCKTGMLNTTLCKKVQQEKSTPSVLLIGIDSTSRLNFNRFMNKTLKILHNMTAVEIKGYTKVGDNTYPNFVPLMTSKTVAELKKICLPKYISGHDDCPFLWKNFSSINYLTAHLEDAPRISNFNYHKTGFVRPPTDFYLRPWMLAAYTEHDKHRKLSLTTKCLGYQRPEEIIFDYVVDLVNLSESNKIPYFITTWLSDLLHEDMNSLQTLDSILSNALQRLINKQLLKNTVVIIVSDHGYRWGKIRSTPSGWYEAKLPVLFVKLTEKLKSQHPAWLDALEYNANQLTTPFDLHETLKQLIGLSKLPVRSCEEAGVPEQYCACNSGTTKNLNATLVEKGAKAILQHINYGLPKKCSILTLKNIKTALVLKEIHNENCTLLEYSISLETRPGNFLFEGLVIFNQTKDNNVSNVASTQVLNVQRTSKKSRQTNCLNKKQQSFELLCYCKS